MDVRIDEIMGEKFGGNYLIHIREKVNAAFSGHGLNCLKNLPRAFITYLALVPLENVHTEHLLETLRRQCGYHLEECIKKCARSNGGDPKEMEYRFVGKLLEPSLWNQAYHQAKQEYGDNIEKSIESICYEVGRFLDKLGYQARAISLFDHIMETLGKQRHPYLYLLSLDGKIVATQNSGDFIRARYLFHDLLNMEGLGHELSEVEKKHILHFSHKHHATFLRRYYFMGMKDQANRADIIGKITHEFELATSDFNTYMVQFSLGHFHYFLSDDVRENRNDRLGNAGECFRICLELLGEDKNEYYLVHFFQVFVELAKNDPKNKADVDFIYKTYIVPLIEKYRNAVEHSHDYKTELKTFLIDIIEDLHENHWAKVEEDIKKKLPRLLGSYELLDSTKKNIDHIMRFFKNASVGSGNWERLNDTTSKIINGYESQFAKKHQILGKPDDITTKDAISVCVDLRGWTKANLETQDGEQKRPKRVMSKLKEMIQIHLADHMDDINYSGDGYIMAKYFDPHNHGPKDWLPVLAKLIRGARRFLGEMARESLGVGIGIAYGTLERIECAIEGTQQHEYHFSGNAANLASRMSDLARPSGLVVYLDKVKKNDKRTDCPIELESIRDELGMHEWTAEGKHKDEFYRILSSGNVNSLEVMHKEKYKYFYKPPFDQEHRLFINYGDICKRGCQYCISDHIPPEKMDKKVFVEEYKSLRNKMQVDDFIFSFGNSNDPLSAGLNFNTTVTVLSLLLEHFLRYETKNIIQIATKESLDTVARLKASIEKTLIDREHEGQKQYSQTDVTRMIRGRIVIFYSLSTVKHANTLESCTPGEKRAERLKEDLSTIAKHQDEEGLLQEYGMHVIPYVKPFLPGITDTDTELSGLLAQCKVIVVGSAYMTRSISHKMALWSLNNKKDVNLHKLADGPYNFMRQYETYSAHNSDQKHPTGTNEVAHVFDWVPDIKKWILGDEINNGWRSGRERPTVFLSSPCALSLMTQSTCLTHVGDGSRKFSQVLCIGKNNHFLQNCPNEKCLYNEKTFNPKELSLGEKIERKLKALLPETSDPSHAIDHFIRVRDLARDIAKEEGFLFKEVDLDVFQAACLLHDLGDSKITLDSADQRDKMVIEFLTPEMEAWNLSQATIERVKEIVMCTSFEDYVNKTDKENRWAKLESVIDRTICKLLEDADRIDAIGAIGIARCFAFRKNRGIYNFKETPRTLKELGNPYGKGFDRYRSAITHFYEKLLNLTDHLNLPASQKLAKRRHLFMSQFLKEFLKDVNYAKEDGAIIDLTQFKQIMKRWEKG
ncbi:MAG: HD domain-containing protein [Nitrospirae bacterium]|nr:HD domain-containing protein [Magnetococcales bacterium]HAT49678.1 hypothetical protein [Alphaproteobacteria bacterium]